MQLPPPLQVQVPASTSNLGPGFDFLGLAFELFLNATAVPALDRDKGAHRVTYEGSSAQPTWSSGDDLVLRSLAAFEARTKHPLSALDLRIRSEIPVGRGFGSSGAAVAAALLIANGSAAQPLRTQELVELALGIEGHPDNGTASLLGGCTAAVPIPAETASHSGEATLAIVQPPVHVDLHLAVAWPDQPLFTPDARAALPHSVPFADAVENPRRLALLLEGLRTADPELLRLGVADRLHERFRRALIPGADAAVNAAYGAGAFAACLSGAGSGVVAFGLAAHVQAVSDAMIQEMPGGGGLALPICRRAPVARRLQP